MVNYPCLYCSAEVRPRQHAISCDICGGWQHRTCNTGITLAEYRQAVVNSTDIHFVCITCLRRELEPDQEDVPHDDIPHDDIPHDDVPHDDVAHDDDSNSTVDDPPTDDDPTVQDMANESVQDDDFLDASFDLSHRNLNIEQPAVLQEDSFQEDTNDSILEDAPVQYNILEKGSQRGGKLLVSSDGFSYCVKNNNKSGILWRCSKKSKKLMCHATVKQVGDNFTRGPNNHVHASDPKLPLRREIIVKAKEAAKEQIFRPAMDIVEDAIRDHTTPTSRFLAPKKRPLKRLVNHYRASFRPKEPSDLDFVIDETFLQSEDFLIADIRVDTQRHIIFATAFQLNLLKRAKEWFIDGTFRIVPTPFMQLASIHAFVQHDGQKKQFPLVFVLMTRRQQRDYAAVFSSVVDKCENIAVEQCILDFEKAAWLAIRETLPNVRIRGCTFHWTQSVWRHVQDVGLATTYRQREGTHKFLRQLLALPFLPAAHIEEVFQEMKTRATQRQLAELVEYVRKQWIISTIFPPSSWSSFKQCVRTNNDVEGWHHRINSKASHGTLGFYKLVPLLRREAEMVAISVSSDDLGRNVRKSKKRLDSRLQDLWTQYMDNQLTSGRFLRACASLYGLAE